MGRLAISLLLAAGGLAAEVPYSKLRVVADRVSCQCGCSYTVGSCNMLNCHFRDPILEEIQEGLNAGRPEEQVLEAVYQRYGPETRVQPGDDAFGRLGWLAPFAWLGTGLAVVVLVLRRWRRGTKAHSRASAVPDEVVDRYSRRIEEDLEELE